MKTTKMRMLDFYFGVPICLFLDIFNKVIRPILKILLFPFRKRHKEVKMILLMKYFGMGSIILSSPMIRALRSKFPDAKILILTFQGNKDIIEMYNLADTIITIRAAKLWFFVYDVIRALLFLWSRNIDIAIDMEFFAKFSTIMTYLSGAPIRVGFYLRQMWRGNLITHHVYYNPYHHVREVFLALAQAVGAYNKDLCILKPFIQEEDSMYIERLLKERNVGTNDKIICINVNAGDLCLERRWPAIYFAKLVDKLHELCKAKLVFIGAEDDIAHTEYVISLADREKDTINLCGTLKLRELAALLKRTALLFTNDSGPLHLAESLGVPTVSLFGPETPVLYGPVGDNHLVFYKNLYCSPCLNVYNMKTAMYGDKRCFEGKNICMQAITVEEVLEEAKKEFFDRW
ncbi:MAG: glycosyltransferase family 9 protein [Candidatus Omnitrophota bacterium]